VSFASFGELHKLEAIGSVLTFHFGNTNHSVQPIFIITPLKSVSYSDKEQVMYLSKLLPMKVVGVVAETYDG